MSLRPDEKSSLAAALANCPGTPDAMLEFTREYGVLAIPAKPGGRFRLPVADWLIEQRSIIVHWKFYIQLREEEGPGDGLQLSTGPGQFIGMRHGRWVYKTVELASLIHLDLVSVPMEKIRRCKREDCLRPFYIAHHLAQLYCSPSCYAWAERRRKLDWWNRERKGKSRRRGRTPSQRSRSRNSKTRAKSKAKKAAIHKRR